MACISDAKDLEARGNCLEMKTFDPSPYVAHTPDYTQTATTTAHPQPYIANAYIFDEVQGLPWLGVVVLVVVYGIRS